MTADIGVIRNAASLERALAKIELLEKRARTPRFLNMLTAARLIADAALRRTESRGSHFRSDFPDVDPAWQHRTFLRLADTRRQAADDAVQVAAG
jgi:L-aspartate oxidase